jgi:hypothetical protein
MPHFRRSPCPLCLGARSGNRYACWCPPGYARAFKITDQPQPAAHCVIKQIIVGEQFYPQTPAPLIVHATGGRPPDDMLLDDDEDGADDDFLPDMFGMFNVQRDLRYPGRVEITQNPTLIASSSGQ